MSCLSSIFYVRIFEIYLGLCEEREDQQDVTIRCLLSTSISTCFGHHYAHLQESKGPVTAFGVLFWFCWMWLVAVVGRCVVGCEHCECYCFLLDVVGSGCGVLCCRMREIGRASCREIV